MSADAGADTGARGVLRHAIAGQRRDVTLGSLLLMGHQVAEALVPVMVGVVVDRAIAPSDETALLICVALLALLFVALSSAFRIGYRVISRARQGAEHELRVALAGRVLDPSGGADAGRLPGELLSMATSDAKRVGQICDAVAFGGGILAAIAVAVVVLLRISLPLGLLVVLGLPPLLVAVNRIARPLVRRAGDQQARAAQVSGLATDLVSGLRVLKGAGGQDTAIARYRWSSREALDATLRAARMEAAYEGAVTIFTGSFLVLVTLVAGRLAAEGQISIGELIAAVGLTQFLIGPLERLGYFGGQLARCRASAERISVVLSAPPAVLELSSSGPGRPRGELRLLGLSSGALHDFDLHVEPGAFVAVVVADADEARALLACLSRDVDPDAGAIELDGVAFAAMGLEPLRRAVLVAPHDAQLFGTTLAENLLSCPGAEVRRDELLAAAGADEVVATLPDGLDSTITERGRSLSGGQRQRIALARALLAMPSVLVLQDPTTAVDAATEARIAAGLRSARGGSTTVVLTSSPALLAASDRVILVEDGTVSATGTHAELLERDAYRELVLA